MIKIYACEHCKYRTKRLADLQRHKNKKSPCINKIKVNVDKVKVHIGGEDIHSTGEDIHSIGEDIHSTGEDIHSTREDIHSTREEIQLEETSLIKNANSKQCNSCFKVFIRTVDCRKHKQKCDATHQLQCGICLKMFASAQSKYNHKKNVKCSPPVITNTTTNNMSNINISMDKPTIYANNNNITNNNFNFIKADFGKENLEKMYRDPNYFKNIADNIEMGRYAIPKTIEFIYFNDDYPENQTLKKDRRNDKLVSIHQKGKWQTRMFEDVQNDILRQSEVYHKGYLQNLEETVDATVKDKKFKERMLPVACFLRIMKENGWSCADVKNIGVNLDYEMDDEDYKRMLSCKKEMELLMLDKIHDETSVMYHNTSVAQNTIE
jgi:hypothetical protein